MNRYYTLIIFFIFFNEVSYCQDVGFSLYVFKDRYEEAGKEFIENESIIDDIKLLGGYMIDPEKKGVINLDRVRYHLVDLFPRPDDAGVLCINLENKLYQDLKNFDKKSYSFRRAEDEFSRLLSFIKEIRPNLRIGIYGIPFRTFFEGQSKWNDDNKFDKIISLTDIIFPSLYILYPDHERGAESNNRYFDRNLEVAFDYGYRLKKPVIPFIWYIVNPGNKRFGGELLTDDEMLRYVKYITTYRSRFQGKRVNGIVWWETTKRGFIQWVRYPSHVDRVDSTFNRDAMLQRYVKLLISNGAIP